MRLPEIENLVTTAEFPVSHGTRVTVQCDEGFSLMGFDVITCILGDYYQSVQGQLPPCQQSRSTCVLKFLHKLFS